MAWMDPLTANLLDLLHELREHPIPLTIGGGFGLYTAVYEMALLFAPSVAQQPENADAEQCGQNMRLNMSGSSAELFSIVLQGRRVHHYSAECEQWVRRARRARVADDDRGGRMNTEACQNEYWSQ
ncbi:MAG: hypothetical protein ABSG53_01930 [Thermoguttaceae bacterium]|jgi:hypothetical protein